MSANTQISATRTSGLGLQVSTEYNASSVSKVFFTAQRPLTVYRVTLRVEVAGTNGSAVTATLVKVPSGTAVASGTDLLSAEFNLKGTAATVQTGTLVSNSVSLQLNQGDSLGIKFTGTLTDATGVMTVLTTPVGIIYKA